MKIVFSFLRATPTVLRAAERVKSLQIIVDGYFLRDFMIGTRIAPPGVGVAFLSPKAMQAISTSASEPVFMAPRHEDCRYVTATSASMRTAKRSLSQLFESRRPILLLGECGVGKRSLVRHLHELSGHRADTLQVIQGSEIALILRAGSNRAAPASRRTLFGSAETVYVSDLEALGWAEQFQLLNILTNCEPGDSIRFISSSRHDLHATLLEGGFREDFYYLLCAISVRIPALRHRRDDLPPLVEFFLEKYSKMSGRPRPVLSSTFWHFLLNHRWPGNVRELEQRVRILAFTNDERLAISKSQDISQATESAHPSSSAMLSETTSLKAAARAASRQAERELILQSLKANRWNRKRAAEQLQISYKALLYKLKQMGVDKSVKDGQEEVRV